MGSDILSNARSARGIPQRAMHWFAARVACAGCLCAPLFLVPALVCSHVLRKAETSCFRFRVAVHSSAVSLMGPPVAAGCTVARHFQAWASLTHLKLSVFRGGLRNTIVVQGCYKISADLCSVCRMFSEILWVLGRMVFLRAPASNFLCPRHARDGTNSTGEARGQRSVVLFS